jgi:UDP-N-acetylmuramyl tripeptide synthase
VQVYAPGHTALVRRQRPPLPQGPYVVAGLGKAGLGAIDLLRELAGPGELRAWDAADSRELRATARRLQRHGVRCDLGDDGVAALEDAQPGCLVKSPGIAPDHPIVTAAHDRGIAVVDELELAWRASRLPMLAVTGTKGKSTVTTLLAAVGRAAAGAAQMAGNTDFAPALSSIRGDGVVACEVSSQQLEGCTDLLPEVAIFTNVHPEANRHGSLEATLAIKRTLFVRGERCVPLAIVNADDPSGEGIARLVAERGGEVVRYGCSSQAEYRVLSATWTIGGGTVELATPGGRVSLEVLLPGRQNAVNAAAAVAAGVAVGLSEEQAAEAIAEATPPPGRCQRVDHGQPFDVVIDMAHTPSSIREVLSTLRAVADSRPGAALRTVLAAPGSTAMTGPRAESGRAARELSDQLIVTGASYRGEPPLLNMASILSGARTVARGELKAVLDRREGIGLAVRCAKPGDVVAVVGRGPIRMVTFDRHGGHYHRSDAEIAADALAARTDA